jgi:hypothetical protein
MATQPTRTIDNDVTILARFLSKDSDHLPKSLARYILDLTINDRDKARMHELAVRNQADELTPAEKDELHAFGRAGDLLAILKSKARRTLGVKPTKRTVS